MNTTTMLCTRPGNIPDGAKTFKKAFIIDGEAIDYDCLIRELPIETCVSGTVAKELIPQRYHKECLKAQAVLARTLLERRRLNPKSSRYDITDLSQFDQACDLSRICAETETATKETAGEVLLYNGELLKEILYSHNNGGRTRLEPVHGRWSVKNIPYYTSKKDKYSKGDRHGHGIGLSQSGAEEQARQGRLYEVIIHFYYEGVKIENLGGDQLFKELKRGDRGEEVKKMQKALKTLVADKIFGYFTERALKKFQLKHGLKATGVLDEITANILYAPPKPFDGNIREALGKIGWAGGHGDNDNPIPPPWNNTPVLKAYKEGRTMRQLATALFEKCGGVNIREDKSNISFEELARRCKRAGCDTSIECHTNWSLRRGIPNRGYVKIIYSIFKEEHKLLYVELAKNIANALGLQYEVVTRKSNNGNWDYYGAVREPLQVGIKHPLIIEYGYHLDFAPDIEGNIVKAVDVWASMLESESVDQPIVELSEEPIQKSLYSKQEIIEAIDKALV